MPASSDTAAVCLEGRNVRARGESYLWEWSADTDAFRIVDREGRTMVSGLLQPAITVLRPTAHENICSAGRPKPCSVDGGLLVVRYEGVNGDAEITLTLRFDSDCVWMGPLEYESPSAEDVVSVHYHASTTGNKPMPSLAHTYLVQPGICQSPALGPVLPTMIFRAGLTTWLGRGSTGPDYEVFQQWGLPAHYFCGVTLTSEPCAAGALTTHRSDAFCCGLAALPNADYLLRLEEGLGSPVLDVRSDLWGHARGPGTLTFGEMFVWTFARTYDEAVRRYYLTLVDAGLVEVKRNSTTKNSVVTAAQFNTWGAQCASGRMMSRFDQPFLESLYEDVRASGMRPRVFVIDDKWEGSYGRLEHDVDRFPEFEQFLGRLRADGLKVGLWAAFLRTDDPSTIGLGERHVLHGRAGTPVVERNRLQPYYLLDISQPDVQIALRERIRAFAERYRPDLVKFDFGYELPSLSVSAPADRAFAGERFLERALELVVDALRSVNPEIAVMYYSLSPLVVRHIDLHSPDDLFLCGGDYDLEANRRFFFSSLLGDLGMPTYGSGGYDWGSMRQIWLDSVVVGSVGSLGAFSGDVEGGAPTSALVAKYNGLAALSRPTNVYTVVPLDAVRLGGSGGARSSSWARFEGGQLVLAALRHATSSEGLSGQNLPLTSTVSTVVASLTELAIDASASVGVVPFGAGALTLSGPAHCRSAEVAIHTLGGGTRRHSAALDDGELRLELSERLDDGAYVEWIEIQFDDKPPRARVRTR